MYGYWLLKEISHRLAPNLGYCSLLNHCAPAPNPLPPPPSTSSPPPFSSCQLPGSSDQLPQSSDHCHHCHHCHHCDHCHHCHHHSPLSNHQAVPTSCPRAACRKEVQTSGRTTTAGGDASRCLQLFAYHICIYVCFPSNNK